MTTVSVVVPTYNRADVLPRAIDSVLNQTFDDFEIIIVDDGSDDNTEEVVQAYSDDRVQYIKQSNQGANAARNRGIEAAEGEYISFLDSDDEYLPERLAQTVAVLEGSDEEYVGVAHRYRIIHKGGDIRPSRTPSGRITLDDLRASNRIGSLSCTLFRYDIIVQIGYLDPDLPASQDYDLYLRALQEGPMVGVDEDLMRYYRHEESISGTSDRKAVARRRLWNKHNNILSEDLKARQQYSRAHQYALNGRMSEARREFWQAFRSDPGVLELYHVILATAGKRPFDAGMALKHRTYNTLKSLQ